jgi:carbon storage regulator
MLVLSRKVNESLVIDGHIKVSIVAIKGNVVRLGIDAPLEVQVMREEVLARQQQFEDTVLEEAALACT